MEAVGKEIAGSKVATVEDTVASDVETPRMGFTLSELEGMELSTVELDDSKVPCSGFVDPGHDLLIIGASYFLGIP